MKWLKNAHNIYPAKQSSNSKSAKAIMTINNSTAELVKQDGKTLYMNTLYTETFHNEIFMSVAVLCAGLVAAGQACWLNIARIRHAQQLGLGIHQADKHGHAARVSAAQCVGSAVFTGH